MKEDAEGIAVAGVQRTLGQYEFAAVVVFTLLTEGKDHLEGKKSSP